MIVKNEEEVIGRCLESVSQIVDEINIVDTGSTDRTKEIISKFTKRIFDFTWINDFAAARNYSFQQATCDYILWLDADDVLLEKDQKSFLELKKLLDPSIDGVLMDYNLAFDSDNNVTSSIKRNRLVKREIGFKWKGAVHEYLDVHGKIIPMNIAVSHLPLSHDANRNIQIYENMISSGKELSPRDLYYYANELCDHRKFEKAIEYYIKFLNTKKGWVEDNIRACSKLADCYFNLGLEEQEFIWTLNTLKYGPPRPETCCRLGYAFLQKNEISAAIYWYKQALETKQFESDYFKSPVCSTWLPNVQLAVCYDKIGQYQLGYEHNEMALKYHPNYDLALRNKKYFEEKLNR